MHTNKILVCLTILFVSIEMIVGEPKRSFGFGRSRPKSSSNISVRRRGHLSDPPKAPAPKQTHHPAPSAPAAPVPPPASAPKINGPPPAYSAGPSSGKTSLNAAPPAYSQSHAGPPSYSSATGGVHANYPRQGMAPAYGSSPYGHQAPNAGWNVGGANTHGGYGGGAMPSYGGYGGHGGMPMGGGMMGGGMPNYGGGMMGGGMMGGGMMGGGMMGGGMQPMYMKQRSGSLLPSIAGGALTGLAVYQLSRAIGGGGYGSHHHDSTQHIYHHYDSPEGPGQAPQSNQNQPAQQTPQLSPQAPEQTLHSPGQSGQTTYGGGVQKLADVPLAPFPHEANSNAENCTENCSTETNVAVTPVPEIDNEFPYSTIHPSLFPYASPSQYKELDFWARSINKKLDLNGPDTDNSATTTSSSK